MKTRSLAFALGLTLLAGCATLPPFFSHVPAALVANGDATLRLSAEVAPGGFGTLATVDPYSATDIHHVTLTVFKLDGSTEIPLKDSQDNPLAVTLSQAQLGHEVALSKLWRNTTYRIKARAYADADEQQLISKGGTTDQIDVAVSDGDRPTVARIKVSLIDKTFDGTATSSVTFHPGTVTASGTPAINLLIGLVSTFAGNGQQGHTNGTVASAQFNRPFNIATDAMGNLYVADTFNHAIRKITPQGVVSTLAGGTWGYANGNGANAQFNYPRGIIMGPGGYLYVADTANNRIRAINSQGDVYTIAGSGTVGYADGGTLNAKFQGPYAITSDTAGNLYVLDNGNNRVRKISLATNLVTTVAGSGEAGYADGPGLEARFNTAFGITSDAADNLYVADSGNHRIRKIDAGTHVVTTVAGSGEAGYADGPGANARFRQPAGIAIDAAGNLFVTEYGGHRIRSITPQGVVSTLAGSGTRGYAEGLGTKAQFDNPFGIVFNAAGNLLVVDAENHRIRSIVP